MTRLLDTRDTGWSFVKVHQRTLVPYGGLSGAAKLTFFVTLPQFDLAGKIRLDGSSPSDAIVYRAQLADVADLVEKGMDELLKKEVFRVEERGGELVDPYYSERSKPVSGAQRSRRYREKRKAEERGSKPTRVTTASRPATMETKKEDGTDKDPGGSSQLGTPVRSKGEERGKRVKQDGNEAAPGSFPREPTPGEAREPMPGEAGFDELCGRRGVKP